MGFDYSENPDGSGGVHEVIMGYKKEGICGIPLFLSIIGLIGSLVFIGCNLNMDDKPSKDISGITYNFNGKYTRTIYPVCIEGHVYYHVPNNHGNTLTPKFVHDGRPVRCE